MFPQMSGFNDSVLMDAQYTQLTANGAARVPSRNVAIEQRRKVPRRYGSHETTLTSAKQLRGYLATREANVIATHLLLQAGRCKQRGRTKSQGSSDACQIDERDVVLATLDATHIRPVKIRKVSKSLLRKFLCHTCTSDRLTKGDEDGVFGERRRRLCHARDCPGTP